MGEDLGGLWDDYVGDFWAKAREGKASPSFYEFLVSPEGRAASKRRGL